MWASQCKTPKHKNWYDKTWYNKIHGSKKWIYFFSVYYFAQINLYTRYAKFVFVDLYLYSFLTYISGFRQKWSEMLKRFKSYPSFCVYTHAHVYSKSFDLHLLSELETMALHESVRWCYGKRSAFKYYSQKIFLSYYSHVFIVMLSVTMKTKRIKVQITTQREVIKRLLHVQCIIVLLIFITILLTISLYKFTICFCVEMALHGRMHDRTPQETCLYWPGTQLKICL